MARVSAAAEPHQPDSHHFLLFPLPRDWDARRPAAASFIKTLSTPRVAAEHVRAGIRRVFAQRWHCIAVCYHRRRLSQIDGLTGQPSAARERSSAVDAIGLFASASLHACHQTPPTLVLPALDPCRDRAHFNSTMWQQHPLVLLLHTPHCRSMCRV